MIDENKGIKCAAIETRHPMKKGKDGYHVKAESVFRMHLKPKIDEIICIVYLKGDQGFFIKVKEFEKDIKEFDENESMVRNYWRRQGDWIVTKYENITTCDNGFQHD